MNDMLIVLCAVAAIIAVAAIAFVHVWESQDDGRGDR
jgi:hypothetical protein